MPSRYLSKQNEKFLIEQSRKFLLTAVRLKGVERFEMAQEELDKLNLLKRAKDGVITQRKAAEKTGVTDRWVRTLLARWTSKETG